MTGSLALLALEGRPLAPARAAILAAGLRGPGRLRPRWICRGGALVAANEASSATRRAQGAGAGGPFQARGGLLLAGDVRLDAPDAVAERLGVGRGRTRRPAHAELVLRLYEARGESALDALAGDFAFALVDLRARRLLAQRDAFGVRALRGARGGAGAGGQRRGRARRPSRRRRCAGRGRRRGLPAGGIPRRPRGHVPARAAARAARGPSRRRGRLRAPPARGRATSAFYFKSL